MPTFRDIQRMSPIRIGVDTTSSFDYVRRPSPRAAISLSAYTPAIATNLYPDVRSLIMCVWSNKPALTVLKTWLWTRVYYLQTARPFNWLPESNDLTSVAREIDRRLAQI